MIDRLVLDWEGDKYIRVTVSNEYEYARKVVEYFNQHYPEAMFDAIKDKFGLSEIDFSQIITL